MQIQPNCSHGTIQIVRDFCVNLLVIHTHTHIYNAKLLQAFQQVNVYQTDLTIIFWFLCNSNFLTSSLRLYDPDNDLFAFDNSRLQYMHNTKPTQQIRIPVYIYKRLNLPTKKSTLKKSQEKIIFQTWNTLQ